LERETRERIGQGYAGVRVTGDTAWLEKNDWKDFCEYEESLNLAVANQRLAVLCTYPLAACGAAEILDVVRTHQFAVTRRRGSWDVIETAGHKQAKAEIKRLNEELEERVLERTSQLRAVNRELTREVLQRQRAEEALLRSEAYLAEAQRVSHTGSFGWSVPSGHIVWSDETFRILEYDPANDPTVEFILQRTHPEDRAVVQETLDQAARDRKVFEFEHRLLMPDGSVKYVRVVDHPSTNSTNDESGDESGNFEFVGAVTDITESKRAEESLRRSEGYLAEAQRLTHTGRREPHFGDDRARCFARGNIGEAGARCGGAICRLALLCPPPRRGRKARAARRGPQPSRSLQPGHRWTLHRTEGRILRHGHVPQRGSCRH
jgi:PAS domain-containing protein